ncbi:peptide deformylase [Roseiterribacter gracilis]|uniref:Peptide deformylase n=1 Tax=Roseiterribacter gracilis TaxID=2812848 RepID=A0A8S8XI21_9PROT|nr:peptide deformylase [Rhodospirillales bacterium TMPK1]
MALRPIIRLGDPILRAVAAPIVDPTDPELARLLADMAETMQAANGVGLAAPQVASGLRAIVWRPIAVRGESSDQIVGLLNPELIPLSDVRELGAEGCLSIPELRGLVPRFARVGLSGIDLAGNRVEREATGFEARILQHEVDHLDGVVYLDRMTDMASLGYGPELDAAREGETL